MGVSTSVAVVLDGGFVLKKLYRLLGRVKPTADDVHGLALACVNEDEDLFRIYYYDCPPYDGQSVHPMTGRKLDFSQTSAYSSRTRLYRELSLKEAVAFRRGELVFRGWAIKFRSAQEMMKNPRAPKTKDLETRFAQKRIDMKIGLDVAWLASKQVVDRIILCTADTDMIPAMKFARREGVQVVLVPLNHSSIKDDMLIHADQVRDINFP